MSLIGFRLALQRFWMGSQKIEVLVWRPSVEDATDPVYLNVACQIFVQGAERVLGSRVSGLGSL